MQDVKINLPAEIGMSELGSLIASEKENLFLRPFSREIELMKTEVAGCRYRENIKESLKALKEGDHMTLVREPLNPYDGRAIMVMGPDESFLGYIPRRKNEVLAALMDAGKYLFARADRVTVPDADVEEGIYWYDVLIIRVFMED